MKFIKVSGCLGSAEWNGRMGHTEMTQPNIKVNDLTSSHYEKVRVSRHVPAMYTCVCEMIKCS